MYFIYSDQDHKFQGMRKSLEPSRCLYSVQKRLEICLRIDGIFDLLLSRSSALCHHSDKDLEERRALAIHRRHDIQPP